MGGPWVKQTRETLLKFSLLTVMAVALLVSFGGSAWADPATDTIYVTENLGRAFGIVDPDTGVGTSIGSSGTLVTLGCAFDTDGTLYATVDGGSNLGTVDLATGEVTVIGPTGASLMYALEIDASGTMYGLTRMGSFYTIDKTTGAATLVSSGSLRGTLDLAFDSSGTLWAVASNSLYTIDTTTGEAFFMASITGASGSIGSLQFDEFDTCYIMPYKPNADLSTVSTLTGVATLVGNTGVYYPHGGDFFVPAAVPVPVPAADIDPDTDGDGIPDDEDHCINSDLSETIVIRGRDTGVKNILFDSGCTMADLLAGCRKGARNHGAYVRRVAALTNAWKKSRLIRRKHKGAIQRRAARARTRR